MRRAFPGGCGLALGISLLSVPGCMLLRLGSEDAMQAPVVVSSQEPPAWTRTTWESVSTPEHRKVLRRGRPATIIGEVVDVSCFLQLAKRGDAHIPCGQKCLRNGQPIGIVTDDGHLYLVFPEEHHARRDGRVSLRESFTDLVGKRVQVSGMVTRYHDQRALFVRTLAEAP